MSFSAPKGILESSIDTLKKEAWHTNIDGSKARYVTMDSIARFNYALQLAKYDSHTVICGQNGTGKSYAQLILIHKQLEVMKHPLSFIQAEANGVLKFMYAYHKRPEFEREIAARKSCVFGIDELKVFFDNMRVSKGEQLNLYNRMEVARANLHCYIGCTRELEKIDINYRQAKAAILIRLWDRVLKDGSQTDTDYVYGSVFVGNPTIPMEDKFMQNAFIGANSIQYCLKIAESLPTYVGPIVIKDIHQYGITDEDIALYEKEKLRGIKEYSNRIERVEKRVRVKKKEVKNA